MRNLYPLMIAMIAIIMVTVAVAQEVSEFEQPGVSLGQFFGWFENCTNFLLSEKSNFSKGYFSIALFQNGRLLGVLIKKRQKWTQFFQDAPKVGNDPKLSQNIPRCPTSKYCIVLKKINNYFFQMRSNSSHKRVVAKCLGKKDNGQNCCKIFLNGQPTKN